MNSLKCVAITKTGSECKNNRIGEEADCCLFHIIHSCIDYGDCSICMNEMTNKDSATTMCLSNCDHRFCTGCISEWLLETPNCPLCRSHVSITDYAKSIFYGLDNEIIYSFTTIIYVIDYSQNTGVQCLFFKNHPLIQEQANKWVDSDEWYSFVDNVLSKDQQLAEFFDKYMIIKRQHKYIKHIQSEEAYERVRVHHCILIN